MFGFSFKPREIEVMWFNNANKTFVSNSKSNSIYVDIIEYNSNFINAYDLYLKNIYPSRQVSKVLNSSFNKVIDMTLYTDFCKAVQKSTHQDYIPTEDNIYAC